MVLKNCFRHCWVKYICEEHSLLCYLPYADDNERHGVSNTLCLNIAGIIWVVLKDETQQNFIEYKQNQRHGSDTDAVDF